MIQANTLTTLTAAEDKQAGGGKAPIRMAFFYVIKCLLLSRSRDKRVWKNMSLLLGYSRKTRMRFQLALGIFMVIRTCSPGLKGQIQPRLTVAESSSQLAAISCNLPSKSADARTLLDTLMYSPTQLKAKFDPRPSESWGPKASVTPSIVLLENCWGRLAWKRP